MTDDKPSIPDQDHEPDHAELALITMRRAAIKAHHRAIETTGSFPTWRDGRIVYYTGV